MNSLIEKANFTNQKKRSFFKNPHFWITLVMILPISALYYTSVFYLRKHIGWLADYRTWEYVNSFNGSLIYIPFLYGIFTLELPAPLFLWLFSLVITLPVLVYYNYSAHSLITNLFFLVGPVMAVAFFMIFLKWISDNKKSFIEKEKQSR